MLKLYKNKDSNYGRGVYFIDTEGKEYQGPCHCTPRHGIITGIVEDSSAGGVRYSIRVRYPWSTKEHVVPLEHAWGNFTDYMTEALDWLRTKRMEVSRRLDGFNHISCWSAQDYDNVMYFRDHVRDFVRCDVKEIDKMAGQIDEIEKFSQADQVKLYYRLQVYSNRLAGWSREIQRLLEKGRLPSKPAVEGELEQVEKLIGLYSRKLTKAAGRKIKDLGPRRP